MESWLIALIVALSIVGIYIILLVTDMIFVSTFKRIFKKHNKALEVLLHAKFDNIQKCLELCKKNKVEGIDYYLDQLSTIAPNSFIDQQTDECLSARNTLSIIRNQIVFISNSNELVRKHVEIQSIIETINELDTNYRNLVAMYNADVLGYNYWIHFLPTRYIFYFFKVKPLKLI